MPTKSNVSWLSSLALSLLLLLVPAISQAAVPLPVTYTAPVPDLSVKVWGGSIVIQRGYFDGAWYPKLNWMPLGFTYDSFDSSIKTITRARTEYSKVAAGVYQDQNSNLLRQTASGFRWNAPTGEWNDYNPAGEIKAYGGRNGTVASFQYSAIPGAPAPTPGTPASEGRISGILDHFGTQVLWFDYDSANQLIRIRDAAAHKVEYQTTATAGGSTLSVLDPDGNTWTYAVTGLGAGITVTDPEAHATARTWHNNGTQASITYPDGNSIVTTQDYDNAKGIYYTREVTAMGKITETWSELKQDRGRGDYLRKDINGITVAKQSLDTATRTTTYTDARGLNTAVTRDQWGNITKTVHPDGSTVTTQYDPAYSAITQHVDENGTLTQNTYDSKGNLLKTIEAAGLPEQRTTEYTYDGLGQRTSQTLRGDANTADAVTQYAYDTHGNIITVTDPEGGITRYTYDLMGNPLTKVDARGKQWTRTYDNSGHLLSVTDPLNRTTKITYNKAGFPISLTDAANNTSTLGYDAAGKLLSVTDPYGANTRYTYDKAGNPVSLTDAANHTQKQEYDLNDRIVKQTDGNNNLTQFVYGDIASGLNGLLVKIIYPTLSQDLQYDQRNRITQSTDSAAGSAIALDSATSQTTQTQYDRIGNATQTTDPANRSTATAYNGLGQITRTTDPAGNSTQYGYDPRGNLTSVTDAKGNIHRFEYDKLDRMVKEISPLGQTITYAYDPNGNLTQVTDAKGQVKQYQYDAANRRLQENHYANSSAATAQTATKSITYTYNTLDRLTGYTDGTTTATYTYDSKQLRQIGESVNYGTFTLATSTSYNALGQKSSVTYPDGATYSYTYDTNNQLNIINLPQGFGSITFNSYQWTVPAQITLPGGTVRNMNYDGLLRLKTLAVKDPGQSQVMNYQYNYDLTNNIVAKATEQGTTNYSYDTLDRLIAANYTNQTTAQTGTTGTTVTPQANETYTYDPVANRLTDSKTAAATWTYNENNQLTQADSISYTYDANGNTTNQTDSANAANTRNYTYDTDNRLIEVRNANNTLIAVYSYDPFGRRISKDTGTTKTYYLYNAEGLIAEADATGHITKSYGYAPGSTYSTNPLWLKTAATATQPARYYTYQNDHLGTPVKLLSQSGQTVWSATYDAFGKATIDPASIITNNLRFPGQYEDAESNLHYNWMRYYDPNGGRYISSDPISLRGGVNMYVYVGGNSLMYIDPLGLCVALTNNQIELIGGVVGGAAAGFATSGFAGAIAGGALGGISTYATQQFDKSNVGAQMTVGAIAGAGGSGGGNRLAGLLVGGATAGITGSGNDGNWNNMVSGMAGGVLGGAVSGFSKGPGYRVITNAWSSGWSGMWGGLAQDLTIRFLKEYRCKGVSVCGK